MIFLRESLWLLLANAAIGYVIGFFKGIPRWGFLLGLLLGPIGWGITMLIPTPGRMPRPRGGGNPMGQEFPTGRACPRCGNSVGRADKACPACGNVLLPIRYKVGDGESTRESEAG